jgi:hypothetical protein
MRSFKNYILCEVHFSDVFSKGFNEFYKKYKSKKNDPTLYVRFDNGNSTDVLSKGFSKDPTHNDPVGTYAYPLKYVIDHPGDIFYGANSKFLKVIKDTSKHKVILSDMEEWFAIDLLKRANFEDIDFEDSYFRAKKIYPNKAKGVTSPGKLFMTAVQMDFSNTRTNSRRNYNFVEPTVRNQFDQSKILKSMRIDCLEDKAKTLNQASIYHAEPEQILWLTPFSFEIIETFVTGNGSNEIRGEFLFRLKRKIVAFLAKEMNEDKIKNSDNNKIFWTVKGREIKIDIYDASLPYRMANLKMGQKKHKMFKKFTRHGMEIRIKSERGDIDVTLYHDEKLSDFKNKFKRIWYERGEENINTGETFSKEKREEEQRIRKREYYKAEEEKKKKEYIESWNDMKDDFNKVCDILNLDEEGKLKDTDDYEKYNTYAYMIIYGRGVFKELGSLGHIKNKKALDNYMKILEYYKSVYIVDTFKNPLYIIRRIIELEEENKANEN